MPSSSDVYPQGVLRHFRWSSILLDIGTTLLKLNFQNYYTGNNIDTYLIQPLIKSKLDTALKSKLLRPEQYALLYPIRGTSDINLYDITILAFLTRCLHPTLPTSAPVWITPLLGDLSIEADVARVREMKNDKWSHAGNKQFEEVEFKYECSQIELLFTRMAKSIANPNYTPTEVKQAINEKINSSFVTKPVYIDQSTSVNSSLQSISTINSNCEPDVKHEIATSTTSLDKREKSSFSVRSAIPPFTFQTKKDGPINNRVLLPQTSKHEIKRNIRQRFYEHCLCCLRPVCCRSPHLSSFKTKDHSHLPHRCFLAGLVQLPNGNTVVSDNTHDVVQVFNCKNVLISEVEYPQPKAVCATSNDIAAVTLSKSSKIVLLQINVGIEVVCCNQISVNCDGYLIDIKHRNGKLYALCDKGDLHMHDLESQNTEIIKTDNSLRVNFFDVSKEGDEFYLTTNQGIVCIDWLGEKWKYRGNRKKPITQPSGIVLHRGRLLVLDWEENKAIALSLSGKWLHDVCVGDLQNPWVISSRNQRVFTTQYSSDLDHHVCREIVTFHY